MKPILFYDTETNSLPLWNEPSDHPNQPHITQLAAELFNADNALWLALHRIRHAELSPVDRELLRPAFAALDGTSVIAVPERVAARIRDIDARLPKERS